MIVHLIVPTHMVAKNIPVYKRMIDAIHAGGHSLARNWIEPAFYQSGKPPESAERSREIVQQLEDAIKRADAVIADVSDHGSVGVGYQIALALQLKKPVLAIQREGTAGGVMMGGIEREGYTYNNVENLDLGNVIKDYLESVKS